MLSIFIIIISFTRLCLAQTTVAASQISAAEGSGDALSSLEDMGLSVLSEILASTLAIVIETPSASSTWSEWSWSASSTWATSTSTPTSTPSSLASSVVLSSNDAKTGPTATSSVSTTSAAASSNSPNHSDRNLAIGLGVVLGLLLLVLLLAGIWLCCRRRKRSRLGQRAVSQDDDDEDDEVNTWQRPMSQREVMQETNVTHPAPPYQPTAGRPPAGVYAPIPDPYHRTSSQNPFEDETYGYNNNNNTHPANRNTGAINNSTSSSEGVEDRAPTPFFGGSRNAPVDTSYNGGAGAIGEEPYNGAVVSRRPVANDATLQNGHRQSVSAEPAYNDATTYNGNGPWTPPAPPRSPRRPRSLPRSPLSSGNGFDFGFQQQPVRHSLNGTYPARGPSVVGKGVTSPIGEAHQRF